MTVKPNFALANPFAGQPLDEYLLSQSHEDEACPKDVDPKRWLKSQFGRKFVRNIADYRAAVAEHGEIFFEALKKTIDLFDQIGNPKRKYTKFSYIHMGARHADNELALIEERYPDLTKACDAVWKVVADTVMYLTVNYSERLKKAMSELVEYEEESDLRSRLHYNISLDHAVAAILLQAQGGKYADLKNEPFVAASTNFSDDGRWQDPRDDVTVMRFLLCNGFSPLSPEGFEDHAVVKMALRSDFNFIGLTPHGMRLLLEHGADPHVSDGTKRNALTLIVNTLAGEHGPRALNTVRHLMEHGADPFVVSEKPTRYGHVSPAKLLAYKINSTLAEERFKGIDPTALVQEDFDFKVRKCEDADYEREKRNSLIVLLKVKALFEEYGFQLPEVELS